MGSEMAFVAPPTTEVPMVEAEAVRQMRDLAAKGWGAKRTARELDVITTLDAFVGLKVFLGDHIGKRVDLVTPRRSRGGLGKCEKESRTPWGRNADAAQTE